MPIEGWTEEEIYVIAERARMLFEQGRYREAATLLEGLAAAAPEDRRIGEALAAVTRILQ